MDWCQEEPNQLWYTPFAQPKQLITRNGAGSGQAAARVSRVPSGLPEGYLEGFATIYSEAAHAIRAHMGGREIPNDVHFPSAADELHGVAFIDACIRSAKRNAAWVKIV